MQFAKQPTETGFYWFKRPPYVKGFWWQKKTTITPDWQMCYVNRSSMIGRFAIIVGLREQLSLNADVEWYGPISKPDDLYELTTDKVNLQILQQQNLDRASTD